MGFGLRIAPGVRISASSRGVRAGIGPRAARVHVGSGRTGFSSGVGPLTYYTSGGSSRRRRPSVSSYERQVRAADRQQEVQAVLDTDKALVAMCQVHLEKFAAIQPWQAPPPKPVDEQGIYSRMSKEALEGISVLKRSERRSAKEAVVPRITAAIAVAKKEQAEAAAADQRRLDAIWQKLIANDPETVMRVLEHAFEDNEAPAACVNSRDNRIDVVMTWPPLEGLVPERKFARTPSGKPTHHKRSQTERNGLYLEALASNAMATVKEALAVAPSINDVGLLVVRKDVNGQRKTVEPLFAGVFHRSYVETINWPEFGVAEDLLSGSRANLHLKGRTKELAALDLSDDPETHEVAEQVAKSLGAELRTADGRQVPRRSKPRWKPVEVEEGKVVTSDVPERALDTTFLGWRQERERLEEELQQPSDPAKRYELLILLTNVMNVQFECLDDELDKVGAEVASMSSRDDPRRPEIDAFMDWMKPWLPEFQREFDHYKIERDQLRESLPASDRERVEANIDQPFEEIKDRVRAVLFARHEPLISAASEVLNPVAEDTKVCPDCAETIKAAARKCRFCGYRFEDV